MRLALLSDIHGNDVAFEAVVAELERLEPEACVCLGDAVQGGAQPAGVLARLRGLGCPVVMGNADHLLLEIPTDSPEPVTERMLEIREWTLSRLSAEDVAFMGSFRPVVELTVEPGTRLVAFHGSPRSFDDVLLPWSEPEAVATFARVEADLLTGGHTHLQWTRRIGDAVFVNPGSVGLAYDHHQPKDDFRLTPVAEFAIVTGGGRDPGVEFRRLPYSRDQLLDTIRSSGRPHAEAFAAHWR